MSFADFSRTCFAAGTPLLTPEGSKYIEDFRVGDLILSRDENDPAGPVVAKCVVNLFQNYSPLLVLHVGGHVIRTTAEHPFWVVGRGWFAAHQIEVGDLLLGGDGEQTAVESIEGPIESAPVYNLEVEEYHTYLVGHPVWGFGVWCIIAGALGPMEGLRDSQTRTWAPRSTRSLRRLTALTGTDAGDWIMRTAPGLTGVDAEFVGALARNPGFTYAELKPLSQNGFDTFLKQLNAWGLPEERRSFSSTTTEA